MSTVPAPQAGAKGKEVASLEAEQDLGNSCWAALSSVARNQHQRGDH